MADPYLGQLIATVTEKVVGEKPQDNVFTSQWLLSAMKEGGGFKQLNGGRLIELGLIYAENTTFRSYTDLETIDTTRVDFIDCVRYDWKEIAGTVVISELEKARAQGDSAKYDLAAEKSAHAKKSLFAVLNRQFYGDGTANNSKDIGGLALIIDDTPATGTVGGINAAVFSFWRNYQATGTNSGTAWNTLRSAMGTCYNSISRGAFAEHPSTICTTATVFAGYESLLTTNERFTSKESGDGGFRNEVLKFKGAKIAFDEDCPASHMYFLNFDVLKFYYPAGRWVKVFPAVEPANQTAEIVKMLVIGNMACNERRRLGVLSACS